MEIHRCPSQNKMIAAKPSQIGTCAVRPRHHDTSWPGDSHRRFASVKDAGRVRFGAGLMPRK